MDRRGFTLIELLVVICILAVLISLSVVGLGIALDHRRRAATETLLQNLSGALAAYQVRWGDYPPSSIAELGGRAPNDLNNGAEALAAALGSGKKGSVLFQHDDLMGNTDNDSVDRNLTDWYWGTNELFEIHDAYGYVIVYFHGKDLAKPRKELTRYRFSADEAELEVAPELHPTTKSFVGAGRYQLRSVGKDGKPGTADDLRPE